MAPDGPSSTPTAELTRCSGPASTLWCRRTVDVMWSASVERGASQSTPWPSDRAMHRWGRPRRPSRCGRWRSSSRTRHFVFDDRLILKLFRRGAGAQPRRRGDRRPPTPGSSTWPSRSPRGARRQTTSRSSSSTWPAGEGWALALTSLRDLYAGGDDPADAGGDFAAEAERLGHVTAELHLALAGAFGARPTGPAAAAMEPAQLDPGPRHLATAVRRPVWRWSECAPDPGPHIVHGDFHLGQRCAPTPAGSSSTSRASAAGSSARRHK